MKKCQIKLCGPSSTHLAYQMPIQLKALSSMVLHFVGFCRPETNKTALKSYVEEGAFDYMALHIECRFN